MCEKLLMSFTELLETWRRAETAPTRTRKQYAVNLPVDDAARLHALVALHPGTDPERIITDLLHAALDETEAAMPYVAGDRVIREDEFGDPVYEDVGMTPRFLELARKCEQELETTADD